MNKEQYKLSMITSANAFVYVMYFQQSFTICAYKDAFYFWGEKKNVLDTLRGAWADLIIKLT